MLAPRAKCADRHVVTATPDGHEGLRIAQALHHLLPKTLRSTGIAAALDPDLQRAALDANRASEPVFLAADDKGHLSNVPRVGRGDPADDSFAEPTFEHRRNCLARLAIEQPVADKKRILSFSGDSSH